MLFDQTTAPALLMKQNLREHSLTIDNLLYNTEISLRKENVCLPKKLGQLHPWLT